MKRTIVTFVVVALATALVFTIITGGGRAKTGDAGSAPAAAPGTTVPGAAEAPSPAGTEPKPAAAQGDLAQAPAAAKVDARLTV